MVGPLKSSKKRLVWAKAEGAKKMAENNRAAPRHVRIRTWRIKFFLARRTSSDGLPRRTGHEPAIPVFSSSLTVVFLVLITLMRQVCPPVCETSASPSDSTAPKPREVAIGRRGNSKLHDKPLSHFCLCLQAFYGASAGWGCKKRLSFGRAEAGRVFPADFQLSFPPQSPLSNGPGLASNDTCVAVTCPRQITPSVSWSRLPLPARRGPRRGGPRGRGRASNSRSPARGDGRT